MKNIKYISVVLFFIVLLAFTKWAISENNLLGTGAGASLTTGHSNTFLGEVTGVKDSSGNSNVFIGYGSGYQNLTGNSNIYIGYMAGYANTASNYKLAIQHYRYPTYGIFGDFSTGYFGIDKTPTRAFDVTGSAAADSVIATYIRTVTGLTIGANTFSTTQAGYLTGITPGTSSATKAAILGATKNLDSLTIDTYLKTLGITLGTTAITATGTEINKLASVTAGTSSASKAAVLGATKNLDSLTIDTYLKTASITLGSTAITSTGTEINNLHNVAAGTASASLAAILGATKNLDSLRVTYIAPTTDDVTTLKIGGKTFQLNQYAGKPAADSVLVSISNLTKYSYVLAQITKFTVVSADSTIFIRTARPGSSGVIVKFNRIPADTLYMTIQTMY